MSTELQADQLRAIIEIQNEIARAALDIDQIMKLVVEGARSLTGAAAAVVELAEGDEMVYRVGGGAAQAHTGLRLRRESSLSGLCVSLGEVLYCRDATTDPRVDSAACLRVGARSMVCVPLRHEAWVIGALKVYDGSPDAFTAADVQTLQMLSGVISAHMSHARDFQRHHHESRHDALTGLLNRRAFDERLRGEIARVRRHGGRLALCLMDLNGFKALNDREGHVAGDRLLAAVGVRLGDLRTEDGAFRIGGDEFALILVQAGEREAELVAQRLAVALQEDPDCQGVSAACGVAGLRSADDPSSLLARADQRMYAAKRAGQGVGVVAA